MEKMLKSELMKKILKEIINTINPFIERVKRVDPKEAENTKRVTIIY